MKVIYDNEVDALYLELGDGIPDGVVEVAEGINVDTTADNAIVGIEILNASKKINLNTIFSYSLEVNKDLANTALGLP
jgi:uncharacterized protein YuzE